MADCCLATWLLSLGEEIDSTSCKHVLILQHLTGSGKQADHLDCAGLCAASDLPSTCLCTESSSPNTSTQKSLGPGLCMPFTCLVLGARRQGRAERLGFRSLVFRARNESTLYMDEHYMLDSKKGAPRDRHVEE